MLEKSVAIIGSTTIDKIAKYTRITPKLGGVTTYAGVTYARHGVSTRVVSNIAPQDESILRHLREEGIEVLTGSTKKTTHFINLLSRWGRKAGS